MSEQQHEEYMGILEVNHYTTTDPVACVGTQIDAPDITEIALYRASMNVETREIKKEALLTKLRMTDGQFGQMIARPNFNYGQLSTLEYVHGHRVLPVDTERDLNRQSLKNKLHRVLSADTQILTFIREIETLGQDALRKGRLSKGNQNEIGKLLGLIRSNLPENEDYALRCFHEESNNRVLDAAKSIHRVLSSGYNQGNPLALDEPTKEDDDAPSTNPEAFLLVSAGGSTGSALFDDINSHGSVTSLTLKKARIQKRVAGREDSYSEDGLLWEIMMSPQQFTRMLRADQTEIPCTITVNFVDGKTKPGPVKAEHTAQMPLDQEGFKSVDPEQNEVFNRAERIQEKLSEDYFRGKSGLQTLLNEIEKLEMAYQSYVEGQIGTRKERLQAILEQQQQKASHYLEKELKRLPQAQREEARKMLGGVVRQVSLPTQKK